MLEAIECTTWIRCDYVPSDSEPHSRMISLSNSQPLRAMEGIRWYETPVAGNEEGLGQAVICIYSDIESKSTVDAAAVDIGCDVLDRADVRPLLVAPYKTYFDSTSESIKFADGEAGRNPRAKDRLSIDRNIIDEIVEPTR